MCIPHRRPVVLAHPEFQAVDRPRTVASAESDGRIVGGVCVTSWTTDEITLGMSSITSRIQVSVSTNGWCDRRAVGGRLTLAGARGGQR